MPTSPSRCTCGSTSTLMPTSRYDTDSEVTPVEVTLDVITGTLSPMWILAFSLFFTRMRGLARILTSPVSLRRLTVGLGDTPMSARLRLRSESMVRRPPGTLSVTTTPPGATVLFTVASGVSTVNWFGYWTPSSCRRLRFTSRISTSSITSGSGRSASITSRSTRRTASGVSRTTSRLSLSSM